jgi:hypothetical protein
MKKNHTSVLPFGVVYPSEESQADVDNRAIPRIQEHHRADNTPHPFTATITSTLGSDVADHIAAPRFMSQFGSSRDIHPFGVVLDRSGDVDRIASPDHK